MFTWFKNVLYLLEKILCILHRLEIKVNIIMSQQTDLDDTLAKLGTVLDDTETELERFIADYKSKTGTDLTAELTTAMGLLGKAQAHHDEIVAADPVPAPKP